MESESTVTSTTSTNKRGRNHCLAAHCSWEGEEVFNHFEKKHKDQIFDLKSLNYFNFELELLKPTTYLLLGANDVYWFIIKEDNDPETGEEVLKIGLFLFDDSNPITYSLKIGDGSDTLIVIDGPHSCTQGARGDHYPIEIREQELEEYRHWSSRKCKLILGEVDIHGEATFEDDFGDVDWSKEENRRMNEHYVEKFTCPVCMEYMRGAIHYCENEHLLCGDCLQKLPEVKKCPVCRGAYLYDNRKQDLEQFAKMIVFPDHKEHVEKMQKLYSTRPILYV